MSKPTSSTVITLTLPDSDTESFNGTLLVQRGDLARLHQFTYTQIADLTDVIADALIAFAEVEADPPVVTELPPPTPASTKNPNPPAKTATQPPTEPTVDIPLKKGKKTVPISRLPIVSGETDAAAYRQAVQIAGRLIDGKLWDGESPIQFEDVPKTAKKITPLLDKELSLFSLEDFVRVGAIPTGEPFSDSDDELASDADELTSDMSQHAVIPSTNGRDPGNPFDQTALF
jgi:hypothetical protein